MAIVIGSNTSSLAAQRGLGRATTAIEQGYQRLASGLRINTASDDAAGLSIASQLNAKSRIYAQGIRNLNDGISLAHVMEGAFTALNQIVTRVQELAEQSANGIYSTTQRTALNNEAQALVSEYSRITQGTAFNGMNLLDGSVNQITLQGGDSTVTLNSALAYSSNVIGTGVFVSQGQVSDPLAVPNGEIIADFNGDHIADVAVNHSSSGGVSIFIGNGDGSFRAASSFASQATAYMTTADLNNDGKLDLVVDAGNSIGVLQVLFGNGDGTFLAAKSVGGGGPSNGHYGVTTGDLNGDHSTDIVWSYGNSNEFWVFINNGDGTFKAPVTNTTNHINANPILTDLNGDGKLDLVAGSLSNNEIGISIGNGDGSFKARTTLYGGTENLFVAVGDVSGDGNVDIVSSDYATGKIDVFLGNGDGTFATYSSFGSGVAGYNGVGLGDFNGDGKIDVLVPTENGNSLELLIGNGNGTFSLPVAFGVGTTADTLAVGDLNNDGILDAVVGDYKNSGHIVALLDQSRSAGGGNSTIAQVIALGALNLTTQQGARSALDSLAGTQQTLASELANIGAFESRVEKFVSTLAVQRENFAAAAGRIQDADIAQESAMLVRAQILQQAAASVLAQANRKPELALTLLKN